MNSETKKAILEARRLEHERRLAEIRAGIEKRRAEREEKLNAVRAGIEARRAERNQRKAGEPAVKTEPDPEYREMMAARMANVPVIHFPE